ncbi:adhesin transport system membrane fusion protein [Neorhizobium huautlense]|uniref:Adhesin transport system membrane fusion protein n=1 Tax=Neorhizobium huautlense TaxID=67774 RepID=A0ABT9PR20_9HYPH|nr:HlyD family efflux transporter periplasmic adaptor subunit [Neorhizobium huautlense]MDP9836909.1 adhesin transport system membrane fusion protein [Neorhizobium huautlense]
MKHEKRDGVTIHRNFGEEERSWIYGEADDAQIVRSTRIIVLAFLLVAAGCVWAWFALLDEVSSGTGRVVPTTREQVIQSLQGGILADLQVRQDMVVWPGQILARLDPTVTEAEVGESAAKYRAALASSARLRAEVNQTELTFPAELDEFPELIRAETDLYNARRDSLEQTEKWIAESLVLLNDELSINTGLISMGAASNVEVLRLKREVVELELKKVDTRAKYIVQAREELAKASAEVEALSSIIRGQKDALTRLTLRSPVRGIVKDIEVSTIGGVVPPNGKLMAIVPLDDKLLIEARIAPRDIAFIHPDQNASVKITAYDYAVYGDLKGKVTTISPDTMRDEADPEIYYYRVFIETEADALINATGKRFPIVPGMVATVDIHTGAKTVFDYLVKPFNKASEALRER